MKFPCRAWWLALVIPGVMASEHGVARETNAFPVRGLAIAAPGPELVGRFAGFMEKELAARGINTLILRVDHHYEFQSHPELRDGAVLTRAQVAELVREGRRLGIRLIPQINLLGHQSWAGHLGRLLQVHPEFDETPWVAMPEKYAWPNPDGLYCKSYCPRHPGVHEVVFALMDELCDAFEADAFHAGMDEVFYLGEERCPRCGGRDKSVLFADEVRQIRDRLAEKKRTLWIWGDRLLDGRATGLGEWEASYNDTHRAVDLIPRDVVICDWHYERAEPTAVYFAMKGLQVVSCPWKKPAVGEGQVQDMVRWRAAANPVLQSRLLGVVQTVWSGAGGFLRELETAAGKSDGEGTAACFERIFPKP